MAKKHGGRVWFNPGADRFMNWENIPGGGSIGEEMEGHFAGKERESLLRKSTPPILGVFHPDMGYDNG